jgi:neuroligin
LADWAAIQDLFRVQNTSRVYGERMGCVVDKSYKLIECLRSRSFEEMGNVRFAVSNGR